MDPSKVQTSPCALAASLYGAKGREPYAMRLCYIFKGKAARSVYEVCIRKAFYAGENQEPQQPG